MWSPYLPFLATIVQRSGARRLEMVADGLPLFGGAQKAIDTTGTAERRVTRVDGAPSVGRGASEDRVRQ